MKKKRIAKILSTFLLMIGIIFAANMRVDAASNVTESDWILTPEKTLVKCSGGECDHTECDYVYSFAVVGDTQSINFRDVTEGTENMSLIYQWLVNKKEKYNIEYVMGVGDITESFNADYTLNRPDVFEYPNGPYSTYEAEWENAKNSVALLDGTIVNGKKISIPYSLVLGNHDNTDGFNGTFGAGNAYYESLYSLSVTEDGVDSLGNTRYMAGFFDVNKIEDTYRKVEFAGHKYIIFTLRRYPAANSGVMKWISDTLTANPEYSAIVTLHQFMNSDATIIDPTDGSYPNNPAYERMLWENCLKYHENVSMIISGHVEVDDIYTTQLRGDNGNTVTCMLVDGQEIDMVVEPAGMVAMLYFSADGEVVNVEYISTVRDMRNENSEENSPIYLKEKNQFALKLDYSNEENDGWTETPYGYIPTEIYSTATFHVLLDDDSNLDTVPFLFGSFNEWEDVLKAIHAKNGIGYLYSRQAKTYYVVMTDDYTDTHSGLHQNEAGKNPGKLVFDLSGYSFTLKNSTVLPYYNQNASFTPNYTIKGGTFNITGSGKIAITQSTRQANGGTVNLTLENLNVVYGASATGLVVSCYDGSGTGGYVNIDVINCNIDSSLSASAVNYFNLRDTNDINHVTMNVQGGSFKGSTSSATTIAKINDLNDKITLIKDENENYPTLTLSDNGSVVGVFYTETEGSYVSYGSPVENDDGYTYTPIKSTVEMTEYGMLDTSAYPVDAHPFVVFKNGSVIHTFKDWSSFINTDLKNNANLRSGCTVLLRKNYSADEGSGKANAMFRISDMTFDLGGNVLSTGEKYLFQAIGRNDQGFEKTEITVKNGTLKGVTKYAPIVFNDNASSTAVESFDFILENLTLDVSAGIGIARSYGDGSIGAKNSITIKDCTILRDSNNKSVNLFMLSDTKNMLDISVNIDNTKLVASSLSGLTFANFNDKRDGENASGDILRFGEGFEVVLPKSVTPTTKYTFTDGTFCLAKKSENSDNTVSYSLYDVKELVTPYGEIAVEYASVTYNTFVVFKNGKVIYSFSDWYKFMNTDIAKNDYSELRSGCTVYMRADYNTSNAGGKASNLIYISDIIFDLGGNTLTSGSKHLFQAIGKSTSANSTYVKIINGTLAGEANGYTPIVFNDNTSSTVEETFEFVLENVIVDVSAGIGLIKCYGDGSVGSKNSVTLNNCTIYRNSSNNLVTLFWLTDTKDILDIDVIINGGKLEASTMSGITFGKYNGTNDTLKFGENENGKLFSVVLKDGNAAPSGKYLTVNGIETEFVKSSENDTATTYVLYPSVMVGYRIKTSVTLYSNFVYNIYIPEVNFNKAMINGTKATATLVEIDGVNYYHVVVNIPAAESLDDIKLTVTLNSGNTTVDANWTLSVLKYAKSVINGNYDETTQDLMKDMLVYASASHTYFENALDADKAAEVTALLQDYSKAIPEGEAKKPTDTTYFTTVGVNVGAVPSFRFYLAAGYTKDNFSFKVGNRTVEATEGNDKYGDYLEVTMYAYMMLDDVTYIVNGTDVSGTYNLYSYLDYAKNVVKDAKLVAIVEGLMKYSVSAKAYRNAVTGK